MQGKLEKLCELQFEKAVELISDTGTVMFKHGVWNDYKLTPTEDAIAYIRRSGYGADVKKDADGVFYVSCPSNGDMW
jgi:hypothetical protein